MKNISRFLFEVGQLKRVSRSGWWLAGIKNPETVAEHSFRTAIIGYLLAELENADPNKCLIMCLFHDIPETRINDFHKVAKAYIDSDAAEDEILQKQISQLPAGLSGSVSHLLSELKNEETAEAIIAHDADVLECLIQAVEYKANGYQDVQEWIDNCMSKLRTESAIKIAHECIDGNGRIWWRE
jgi:putative hydrolase of HD superfamily